MNYNRLLIELGVKEDPVWHYLSFSHDLLCKTFDNVDQIRAVKRGISSIYYLYTILYSPLSSFLPSIPNTVPLDRLIKDICTSLVSKMQKHWKLTELILAGDFYKVLLSSLNLILYRHSYIILYL